MENRSNRYNLFFFVFVVGALSGLLLTTLATWADLEAAYYGFSRRASTPLKGFSCPVLMTAGETNVVSLKIKNTTDGKISPTVVVETSSPVTAYEFNENIEIAAGEQVNREWTIGPDNLDLKRFIFAKALIYSSYPLPDSEITCGIYVLNLPGTGAVFTWGLVVLSLFGMGIGLYGVYQTQGPLRGGVDVARLLMFFTIVVLLSLTAVLVGSWLWGVLMLVVSILLTLISAGLFIGRARV